MDIKIEGFYVESVDFYQMTLDIRKEVFVDEFGFDKHLEFDGKDSIATHYIVLFDGKAVGCARWINDESKLRIDRFGILKSYRAWGLGLLLIKFIKHELVAVKKKIELLSTSDNVVFFIQQGLKDSNAFEDFGKKRVKVLNF
jgi:predicted GNAT family N-acyltransferase